MKTQNLKFITILMILLGSFSSCKGKESKGKHDLISSDLLKTDSVEYASLIGEWDIIKFAYTDDGENISNLTVIPIDSIYDIEWIASYNGLSIEEAIDGVSPKLKIPNPPITPPEDEWNYWDDANQQWVVNSNVLWCLSVCNTSMWICSLSGNLINLKRDFSTKKGCGNNSAENDIWFALSNAYRFVTRSDELIIFFTGVENLDTVQKKDFTIIENHNSLILKRRTKQNFKKPLDNTIIVFYDETKGFDKWYSNNDISENEKKKNIIKYFAKLGIQTYDIQIINDGTKEECKAAKCKTGYRIHCKIKKDDLNKIKKEKFYE